MQSPSFPPNACGREVTEAWIKYIRYTLGQSPFRVEREFNALSVKDRNLLIVIADITEADLISPMLRGVRLAEYNEGGRRKLAEALKRIRKLSACFSEGITVRDFLCVCEETER